MPTVILDSEAVSALGRTSSSKHRAALALIVADRGRPRRRPAGRRLVVPSTVRVEAGWDRTMPRWSALNQLDIVDHHLDRESTDTAARLRAEHGVSPADAHIGAIAHGSGDDQVVVITSDVCEITAVTAVTAVTAGTGARIIRL